MDIGGENWSIVSPAFGQDSVLLLFLIWKFFGFDKNDSEQRIGIISSISLYIKKKNQFLGLEY